ncbi:hypothetical protein KC19_VG318700 [Ceratodon purpureus]|uniref:Uncharacterized protein n=1 Tax=Ceratodon purpureus TaxID=3225 RepID=A0A8T0HXB3_CERPU|nr:hypothetical protein KC19_VG318700 [Ceratodon purpureus]
MDVSSVLDYETVLCEENDGNDGWWFPNNRSDGGSPIRCREEVDRRSALVLDEQMPSIDSHSLDLCEGLSEGGQKLSDSEINHIDALCTRFGLTVAFKQELVNVVFLLLALRKMQVVRGDNRAIERTPDFTVWIVLCILFTLLVLCFSACRFREMAVWAQFCKSPPSMPPVWVGKVCKTGESQETMGVFGVSVLRNTVHTGENGSASDVEQEVKQTVDEGEALGAWSHWYDNMTDEVKHNLECWSPK